MARQLTRNVANDLREQTSIVEVISRYMTLEKRGRNYIGLCPFHGEKTPSFYVYEETKRYKCYGCGVFGDVFEFVGEIEGMSFPESVKKVAEIERIPLDVQFSTQAAAEKVDMLQPFYEVYEESCRIFEHTLHRSTLGVPALAYLEERGLTSEVMKEFRIGFSPDDSSFLSKTRFFQKMDKRLLTESGLFTESDKGDLFDFFRGRIVFPVRNAQGKVVAFSGRVLEDAKDKNAKYAKYKNSPETPIYKKSQVLFNYDLAQKEARKEKELYVFEGQFDVIRAYQAGVKNVVGTMGTALTGEYIEALKKVTQHVILSFDGDKAGLNATQKAILNLESDASLELEVVRLPDNLDPDEYLKKYGAEGLIGALSKGRESVFGFKKYFLKLGKNLENETELIQYVDLLMEELTRLTSHLQVEFYINQIVQEFPTFTYEMLFQQYQKRLGAKQVTQENFPSIPEQDAFIPIPEQEAAYAFEPEKLPNHFFTTPNQLLPKRTVEEKAEQQLLYRALKEKKVREEIKNARDFNFMHEEYSKIFTKIEEYFHYHNHFEPVKFFDFLQESSLESLMQDILLYDFQEESERSEITDLMQRIRLGAFQNRKLAVKREMEQATRSGNHALEEKLTLELINIERILKNT